MTEAQNRPQPDDAVLSNTKSDRSVVLGGIERVKQRLSSSIESDRIEALSQALQYGQFRRNLSFSNSAIADIK